MQEPRQRTQNASVRKNDSHTQHLSTRARADAHRAKQRQLRSPGTTPVIYLYERVLAWLMEPLKATVRYLANLEWTERKQEKCKFCDPENLENRVYDDGPLIVIENIRKAGDEHWLVMPKPGYARHIRDIEALTKDDLPLLEAMQKMKDRLLRDKCPNVPPSDIHCGYHRGRRTMVGPVVYPDIISIHHLHMHVIVRPRWSLWMFKYPSWLPLMWMSDQKMMQILETRDKPRMEPAAKDAGE